MVLVAIALCIETRSHRPLAAGTWARAGVPRSALRQGRQGIGAVLRERPCCTPNSAVMLRGAERHSS